MGSYLSEPVTEKVSSDEANDKLNCGSSSMQGWRVTQEDAHNCLLDFDTNTYFFAVYDGHGGHEVAQYCSQKLPNYIKETDAYKNGDIEKALVDGFLGFDATIATREVVAVLKEIAGDKEAEEESDEEENVDNLYKEAAMPIEQVIEQYTNLVNPAVKNLKKAEGTKAAKSPCLKAKKDESNADNIVDAAAAGSSSCSSSSEASRPSATSEPDGVSSSDSSEAKIKDESKDVKVGAGTSVPKIEVTSPDSSDSKEATPSATKTETEEDGEKEKTILKNGEVCDSQPKSDVTSSTTLPENGQVTNKGKGKAIPLPKSPRNNRPKRNAKMLYKCLLDFENNDSEDSEDEEDKTFEGPNEPSTDDDEEEDANAKIESENSDESSASEEDEEECEEDEDDDDDDEGEIAEEDLEFARNMKEEPGSDSGCTAVVALMKGNQLYVANAGDSRCIVCRNGKAIEMSFDHKPEDEPERERIVKAGGKVMMDGRVNGGLNLSRAIGDHAYKQNKDLSDKEQMITALPDIKTLTINPSEDEFMVLACDGIWNFMSSQEVVDFVRPRIATCGGKLSTICEEMFEHCLAPDTMCDGTGCDNMTAIIVQFKTNLQKKRSASRDLDDDDNIENETEQSKSKRAKTDDSKDDDSKKHQQQKQETPASAAMDADTTE